MLKKLILTTMLVGVCCVVSAQVTIKAHPIIIGGMHKS